ncbi:MAG: thioredoxin [Bacilli bacterium]|nr:thioredoxin [Bacilli bacterium]
MKVIIGTNETFEKEVLNSKNTVLVDFNAEWCGPCKMLAPIIEKIAQENEQVKVMSLNVDNNEELAREYNVFSIPCLVLFKDGKEEKRHVGLLSQKELEKFIGE